MMGLELGQDIRSDLYLIGVVILLLATPVAALVLRGGLAVYDAVKRWNAGRDDE